jgi:hypothetical protein
MIDIISNSLQEPQDTYPGGIHGKFRNFEAYLDMTLGTQVIDFIRINCVDSFPERPHVSQFTIVKIKVRISQGAHMKVIDPFSVKSGCPSDKSVDFVTLGQQKFSQVTAVLSGYPSDKCDLFRIHVILSK